MLCIGIACVLALHGIVNHAFWDDEANTALFARNLLAEGKLLAWDGDNLIGFWQGAELNEDLVNSYMPPLQYYVAAAGLAVFGENTFGCRIVFVLCGLLALVPLAVWARRHLGAQFPWFLPAMLAATSTAYLLYIRQCRYYALSVLFGLILLAAWASPRQTRFQLIESYTFGVSATILLWFANPLAAMALLGTLPLFLFHREYRARRHFIFLGVIYAVAFCAGIYLLLTTDLIASRPVTTDLIAESRRFFILTGWYLSGLGSFEFFPLAIIPLLFLPFFIPRLRPFAPLVMKGFVLSGALILYCVIIALFSPQPVDVTRLASMRYAVPLIALGCVITAIGLYVAWRLARPLAWLIGVLVVFTNVLYLPFPANRPVACTLCKYVAENANNYTTGTEALIQYLATVEDGAIVGILPEFMAYSPMFYVPAQRYCCQLRTDHFMRFDLRRELPDYIFSEYAKPDLVLVGGRARYQKTKRELDRRYGRGSYRLERLIPVYWGDGTRPEIPLHAFEPPPEELMKAEGIAVLRAVY